jgi:hypothetical protein
LKFKIWVISLVIALTIKFSLTKEVNKLNIWGTHYYTPQFNSIMNGIPLKFIKSSPKYTVIAHIIK